MFFPTCTVLPLEIIALRLFKFLPKCPNIFSSPFTGSIPKLKKYGTSREEAGNGELRAIA